MFKLQTEQVSSMPGANIIETLSCSGWAEFCQDFNISGNEIIFCLKQKFTLNFFR